MKQRAEDSRELNGEIIERMEKYCSQLLAAGERIRALYEAYRFMEKDALLAEKMRSVLGGEKSVGSQGAAAARLRNILCSF